VSGGPLFSSPPPPHTNTRAVHVPKWPMELREAPRLGEGGSWVRRPPDHPLSGDLSSINLQPLYSTRDTVCCPFVLPRTLWKRSDSVQGRVLSFLRELPGAFERSEARPVEPSSTSREHQQRDRRESIARFEKQKVSDAQHPTRAQRTHPLARCPFYTLSTLEHLDVWRKRRLIATLQPRRRVRGCCDGDDALPIFCRRPARRGLGCLLDIATASQASSRTFED